MGVHPPLTDNADQLAEPLVCFPSPQSVGFASNDSAVSGSYVLYYEHCQQVARWDAARHPGRLIATCSG
jgi:hypothetical protein